MKIGLASVPPRRVRLCGRKPPTGDDDGSLPLRPESPGAGRHGPHLRPPKLSWGKTLAACLRQPLLSERVDWSVLRDRAAPGISCRRRLIYVTLVAGSPGSSLPFPIPNALKSSFSAGAAAGWGRAAYSPGVVPPRDQSRPPATTTTCSGRRVDYDDGFAKTVYAEPAVRPPIRSTRRWTTWIAARR